MSRFRSYLDRQQPLPLKEHLPVTADRSTLFVTIPCYDEPDLLSALSSLAECTPPSSDVTVIVVVNSSVSSPQHAIIQNQETIRSIQDWWEKNPRPFFTLRLIGVTDLPSKWAGVGWARKIAMDEAVKCLDTSEKEDGILIGFDADATVSPGYFRSIESAFNKNPQYNFVTLDFCHPVDDPSLSATMREGIILYELYLRYLRNAIQYCGYPHAIHTVGSSFAVRASAYVKQGGMNRRKAGEDFHFLHKIVLLGKYGTITDATVYPAARISDRVPFGTGAALKKWAEGDPELYSAYSMKIFETLRPLFSDPGYFYKTDPSEWNTRIDRYDSLLRDYIAQTGTIERIAELKSNCADIKNFIRRFYHQVNAFWIIQYLNLCEAFEGGKGELVEEASKLAATLNILPAEKIEARELLEIYRQVDKR